MKDTLTSGKFWLQVFICFALVAVIVAVLFPIFAQAKEGRRRPMISNLKQLALATIFYREDYEGRLPFFNPFEFGDDPLEQYTKNKNLHRVPEFWNRKSGAPPIGTDFHFQFVVLPIAFESKQPVRTIFNVARSARPESAVLAWIHDPERKITLVAYADGAAKSIRRPYRYEPIFDPTGLLGVGSRLVGPEEQWPPPTWSLPIEDVLRYAESQKR